MLRFFQIVSRAYKLTLLGNRYPVDKGCRGGVPDAATRRDRVEPIVSLK